MLYKVLAFIIMCLITYTNINSEDIHPPNPVPSLPLLHAPFHFSNNPILFSYVCVVYVYEYGQMLETISIHV